MQCRGEFARLGAGGLGFAERAPRDADFACARLFGRMAQAQPQKYAGMPGASTKPQAAGSAYQLNAHLEPLQHDQGRPHPPCTQPAAAGPLPPWGTPTPRPAARRRHRRRRPLRPRPRPLRLPSAASRAWRRCLVPPVVCRLQHQRQGCRGHESQAATGQRVQYVDNKSQAAAAATDDYVHRPVPCEGAARDTFSPKSWPARALVTMLESTSSARTPSQAPPRQPHARRRITLRLLRPAPHERTQYIAVPAGSRGALPACPSAVCCCCCGSGCTGPTPDPDGPAPAPDGPSAAAPEPEAPPAAALPAAT